MAIVKGSVRTERLVIAEQRYNKRRRNKPYGIVTGRRYVGGVVPASLPPNAACSQRVQRRSLNVTSRRRSVRPAALQRSAVTGTVMWYRTAEPRPCVEPSVTGNACVRTACVKRNRTVNQTSNKCKVRKGNTTVTASRTLRVRAR
jgi:hypothetical protein